MTREEIRDEIWDALMNRMDIDVSTTDLADAALERLESLGLIAIGAEYDLAPTSPTGEAGAPNLSTLFPLMAIAFAASTFAASFIMGAAR